MTSPSRRYGIDTSVLVRLLTGDPPHLYSHCLAELGGLVTSGGQVLVSNQVIGEAYFVMRHHYGATEEEARSVLLTVFRSGLVSPLNGEPVREALAATSGPGLFDRLISDDYRGIGLEVLTLDRQMASLPNVRVL